MIWYIIIPFVFSLQCEDTLAIKGGDGGLEVRTASYLVTLFINNTSRLRGPYQCVGVVVNPLYVLTTKECTILSNEDETLMVRYGSKIRDRGSKVRIVHIYINEIQRDRDASTALLKLGSVLQFPSDGNAPVTLPGYDIWRGRDVPVKIIGYGVFSGTDGHHRFASIDTSIYGTSRHENYFFALNIPRGQEYSISSADEGSPVFAGNNFVGIVTKVDPTRQFLYIINIFKQLEFIRSCIING